MPGRGQYDRAAAKARRTYDTGPGAGSSVPYDSGPHYVHPDYPYINKPESVVELQAKLDAANALLDRYKDLVRRNGLWLDE